MKKDSLSVELWVLLLSYMVHTYQTNIIQVRKLSGRELETPTGGTPTSSRATTIHEQKLELSVCLEQVGYKRSTRDVEEKNERELKKK